jgi:hypothetical protein
VYKTKYTCHASSVHVNAPENFHEKKRVNYRAPTASAKLLPIFFLIFICNAHMTGIGATRITQSVIRAMMKSLMKITLLLRHVPGCEWFQNFSTGVDMKISARGVGRKLVYVSHALRTYTITDDGECDIVQRQYGDNDLQRNHEPSLDVKHTYQEKQDGKFSYKGSWAIEDFDNASNLTEDQLSKAKIW